MNKYLLIIQLLLISIYVHSQQNIGIGTTMPNSSSILDITSTTRGILIPRMTSAERGAIVTPAMGLLVYDNTTQSFWYRNSTAWINLQTSKMLADSDGDTKIQVEESPDEDIIRFDLAGIESMVLQKNSNGDILINPGGLEENIFIGRGAGNINTGFTNIALGDSALHSNTSGFRNTAVGFSALFSNTTADYNSAVGYMSLNSNINGGRNSATGYQSLYNNIDGNFNSSFGERALYTNAGGDNNSSLGSQSLYDNTTGSNNTASGYQSLFNNTTGNSNVAYGVKALYQNTVRSNLVAVGDSALYNNGIGAEGAQGSNNTSIGSKALFANTLGWENTATGSNSLYFNTSGYRNTGNGNYALYNNGSGFYNSAFGSSSLEENTTGDHNTGFGASSLFFNVTGNGNTAVGSVATYDQIALNNTSCFGYLSGGVVDVSNRIEIGNTSVTWIGGDVAWSTYSDARIKDNVSENVPGLSFITRLRPVTYNLNIHRANDMVYSLEKLEADWPEKYDIEKIKMTGFLAQEVEQAAIDAGYDFSGIDIPKDPNDLYSLRYSDFVMPLVKAVQELSVMNEEFSTLIKIQTEKIASQDEIIENLILQLEKLEAHNLKP